MAERRSLVEGLNAPPPAAPIVERDFVYGGKSKPPAANAAMASTPATVTQIARAPLSTRIRTDFAQALKRASLERQLGGIEPSTLQDILEEAVEPWLKSNGYLD